jgi:hypothetical protein
VELPHALRRKKGAHGYNKLFIYLFFEKILHPRSKKICTCPCPKEAAVHETSGDLQTINYNS